MTPEEVKALKDERLRLRVQCLRKEAEIQDLRIRNGEADVEHTEGWMIPHRRYHTSVYRHVDGQRWICACGGDRGDMLGNTPYGEGNSPAEACADFDRCWTEGDYEPPEGDLCV